MANKNDNELVVKNWWDDIGYATKEVGKDIVEGYANSGEMFQVAGESFKGKNIGGGIYQGAMGVLSFVGNTLTFGQANRWGEEAWDKIDQKIEIVPEYMKDENGHEIHGYLRDGEIVIDESTLDDGKTPRYGAIPTGRTECKETNGTLGLIERYWLVHDAQSVNTQRELVDTGHVGAANVLGTIDTAGLALDIFGGAQVLSAARTAVFGPTAKELGKKLTDIAGKNISKDMGAKTAVKEGAKTVTKEAAESGAKTAVKEGAKTVTKEAAESGAKTAAGSAFSTAEKYVVSNTMKAQAPKAAKGWAAVMATGDVVLNGKRALYAYEHPIDETVTAAVQSLIGSTTSSVSTVTDAAGEYMSQEASRVATGFLAEHKGLAKIVNSCRAAAEATSVTAGKLVPTSYAVATCSVAKAKFSSFMTGKEYAYLDENKNKMKMSEIADDIRKDAQTDTRSWKQVYSDRVTELDAKYGIDREADKQANAGDGGIIATIGSYLPFKSDNASKSNDVEMST